MSQEERSIFWEVIVSVILSKKVIGEPWFPGLRMKTPWQAVESL
jgi:hypothetical protein